MGSLSLSICFAKEILVSNQYFSVPAEIGVSTELLKTVQLAESLSSIFASVGECNSRTNRIVFWEHFKWHSASSVEAS